MAASGLWFMTPHAVQRYIERFAPRSTYEEALSALIRVSVEARRVKVLPTGLVLYRGPRPRRLRFFLQESVDPSALPILVTVLGRSEGPPMNPGANPEHTRLSPQGFALPPTLL